MTANWNAQLLKAAKAGDVRLLHEALKGGADINANDDTGNTALILASLRGHTEMVRALVAAGAHLDVQNMWGNTALMLVSHKGHAELARALIAEGADINCHNSDDSTALLWASQNGHSEIVALLQNAATGIRPSREDAWPPPLPPAKEQARSDRRWQEAEGIRKKLQAGITDPSEVGF